jgi:dienelactone hydrolase
MRKEQRINRRDFGGAGLSRRCFFSQMQTLGILAFVLFARVAAPAAAQASGENWTDLSLHGQKLKAEKPLVGEIDQCSTFTRQIIEVRWRPNDPIYLYVLLPKLTARPAVILYLNNYATDSQLFMDNDYGKLLTAQGVAAVGFASALSGQRYHDRPMAEWFVSELPEALGATVHDVQMILNYLTERNDLDMTRVGIVGDGSGGAAAVMAAAVDGRIRVIDLLDPWGDWPDWLAKSTIVPGEERARYLEAEFLSKAAPLDPIQWLPRLRIPIRLQYLRKDGATPAEAAERMKKAAPAQTTFVPLEEALGEYRAAAGSKFFDWIKGELRNTRGRVGGSGVGRLKPAPPRQASGRM